MTSPPAILIRDLSLQLGDKTVLDGVNLQVATGEFRLIIGPNGAGKSSLLRCLLGIWRGYRGQIHYDTTPLTQLAPKALAKRVAYVPQILDLQFNLSVRSFLELSRYAHDDPSPAVTERAIQRGMELTATKHLAEGYLDELSGGERQRVLIAAGLAQEPDILVLDEPTNALDPGHRVDLVRLLDQLYRDTALTVLAVTHDWNEFLHLDPIVLALTDGKVAFECGAAQLPDHLETLFHCQFEHIARDGYHLSHPIYTSK